MPLPSLAIVETPLQLLCAYEAMDGSGDSCVVLRLTGVGRNDLQTRELASRLGMRCTLISAPVGKPFMLLRGLWHLRKVLMRRYGAIYLGSYFSGFIRTVGRLVRGPLVLLDDGMATLLAQTEMRRKGEAYALFTFIDVVPIPGQKCERHDFSKTREEFGGLDRLLQGRCFIGQPLVRNGLLDEREYLSLVVRASDGADRLSYIAHRAEPEVLLERIAELPGVTVIKHDLLVELVMLSERVVPRIVYSCCSTSLLTLAALFPAMETIALIPDSLRGHPKLPHLDDIVVALQGSSKVVRVESGWESNTDRKQKCG